MTNPDIEQIRRAHRSARPKPSNPAWCNCHRDCGVLLAEIERLERGIAVDQQRLAYVARMLDGIADVDFHETAAQMAEIFGDDGLNYYRAVCVGIDTARTAT